MLVTMVTDMVDQWSGESCQCPFRKTQQNNHYPYCW